MTDASFSPAAPSAWERADGREVGVRAVLYDAVWQVRLVAGLVAAGAGAAVLARPVAARLVVGAAFGIYLLSLGVLRLTGRAASHTAVARHVLTTVTGAVAIVLGVVCLLDLRDSALLLVWWTGCGLLLRGVGRVAAARRTPGRCRRWRRAGAGASSVAAGALLWAFPVTSLDVLTVAAGGWLLCAGCAGAVHGAVQRHRRPVPPRSASCDTSHPSRDRNDSTPCAPTAT